VVAVAQRNIIRKTAIGLLMMSLSSIVKAATPDLSGYWMVEHYIEEVKTLEGQTPPLKPEAKKLYDERKAAKQSGKTDFDPVNKCVNPGVPRLMFLPYAVEFLQRPKELTMLFAWNHLYRNVDLSGASSVAPYPMYVGVSAGKWVGNTLVIETSSLKEDLLLDASGLPASGELKVTEQYTLNPKSKKLQSVITIDDPTNYTKPWRTQVTYRRLPDSYQFFQDVCLDRIDTGQAAIAK